MNILHLIPFDVKGGAETFVIDLIKSQLLNKKINKIILFTFQTENNKNKILTDINSSNFEHINVDFSFNFFNHLFVITKIFFILLCNNINVVHTHLISALYGPLLTIFFPSIKFLHTIHNQADKELGSTKNSIYYKLRKFYYYKITVISISESVKGSVYDYYNLKTQIIFNGAKHLKRINNDHSFKKHNDSKILLAVGNTRIQKNFEFLIQAFRIIKPDYFVKLFILGALVDEFENINIKKYENEGVFFKGSVNNVQDYMKDADFLCMPSLYEGLPITLIEAKANNLLPVVTPVPGIVDMVTNSKDGFIAKNTSLDEYVIVLREALATDVDVLDQMKKNGSDQYLSNFTIKNCAEKYYKLYTELQ